MLTIRVLCWNVHKCVGGLDRRYDPLRIAGVIAAAEPHVVLLQEVAQAGHVFRGDRQVDVLADALGMAHRSYFVNVRFGPHHGEYGNAILSHLPIAATENVDLTIPRRKARSVLHAELKLTAADGHSRTLHVLNLHLGLSGGERFQQLRRLLECRVVKSIQSATPIVLAGDFNDVWGTLGPRILVPGGFRGPRRPLRTFPAWAPVRALDSVYVRGDADVTSLERVRTASSRAASDHLPLVAVVDVKA